MTTREFEDLTNQYLDNEISQENLLRLKRAIAGSELLRSQFNQACKLHVAEKRALCGRKKPLRTMSRGSHFGSSARVRGDELPDETAADDSPEMCGTSPSPESETEAATGSTAARGVSLQELTRWEEEHAPAQQNPPARRSFSRHSTPRGEARPRKIYWLYPFWMLFVAATMGYVLMTLPQKMALPEDNEKLSDAEQRAFTLSERSNLPTPNVSIPTANASIALAQTRTAVLETRETPNASRAAAAPVQNAVAAPAAADRPTQVAAVEHMTPLIPAALQEMSQARTQDAQAPAPQTTSSPVQGDEASMRLENALTELFEQPKK